MLTTAILTALLWHYVTQYLSVSWIYCNTISYSNPYEYALPSYHLLFIFGLMLSYVAAHTEWLKDVVKTQETVKET